MNPFYPVKGGGVRFAWMIDHRMQLKVLKMKLDGRYNFLLRARQESQRSIFNCAPRSVGCSVIVAILAAYIITFDDEKRNRESFIMPEGIPLRSEREVCYNARNVFFTCCDRNNIVNPLRDVDRVQRLCRGEKERFDRHCMSSWVLSLDMTGQFH